MSETKRTPSVPELMVKRKKGIPDTYSLSLNAEGGFKRTARAIGMFGALWDLGLLDTIDHFNVISGTNLALIGIFSDDPSGVFQRLLNVSKYMSIAALPRLARGAKFINVEDLTFDTVDPLDCSQLLNNRRIRISTTCAKEGKSLSLPAPTTKDELVTHTVWSLHTPALAGPPIKGKTDNGLAEEVAGIPPINPDDTHALYFLTRPKGTKPQRSFIDERFGRYIVKEQGYPIAGDLVFSFEPRNAKARKKVLQAEAASDTPFPLPGQTLVKTIQVPATEPNISPFAGQSAMRRGRDAGYNAVMKVFVPFGLKPEGNIFRRNV